MGKVRFNSINSIILLLCLTVCLFYLFCSPTSFGLRDTIGPEIAPGISLESPTGICIANLDELPGTNLLVTDYKENRIYILDLVSYELLLSFGEYGSEDGNLNGPVSVAASNTKFLYLNNDSNAIQYIYISDKNNHRINKYNVSGAFVSSIGEYGSGPGQFNYPCGIDVDNKGRLYVADLGNGRVQVFDSNDVYIATIGDPGQFDKPIDVGIIYHRDMITIDYIAVSDNGNDRVLLFNEEFNLVTTLDNIPCPMGIAPDLKRFYVISGIRRTIFQYNGNLKQKSISDAVAPYDTYTMFVTDSASGKILKYSPFDIELRY